MRIATIQKSTAPRLAQGGESSGSAKLGKSAAGPKNEDKKKAGKENTRISTGGDPELGEQKLRSQTPNLQWRGNEVNLVLSARRGVGAVNNWFERVGVLRPSLQSPEAAVGIVAKTQEGLVE